MFEISLKSEIYLAENFAPTRHKTLKTIRGRKY
jgi:hypothetical protein